MSEIRKRNQALFERLEARGFPLDNDGVKAPFNFVVSWITSYGVADDQIITNFSRKIRHLARNLDFQEVGLEYILIFPMILDPEVPVGRNSSSFRRGTYKVKRQIDFHQ